MRRTICPRTEKEILAECLDRTGQVEIFTVMLKLHEELFEATVQKAKEAGFEVDESEEDESNISDAA